MMVKDIDIHDASALYLLRLKSSKDISRFHGRIDERFYRQIGKKHKEMTFTN